MTQCEQIGERYWTPLISWQRNLKWKFGLKYQSLIHICVNVCRAEEQARRYAVPSYEEAVGSGQYPVSQNNPRPSACQLPSYEDLVQVDGVQYEIEGSDATATGPQPPPTSASPAAHPTSASASNRRPGKNNRKLLPIKIRRIKSEKTHMKNTESTHPTTEISIEPLTPPPQYDKVPPI